MTLQIAERWFEEKHIGDGITLLWEPHVIPLMRCNIWHLRGRDRDLLIDTGMGVGSLHDAPDRTTLGINSLVTEFRHTTPKALRAT